MMYFTETGECPETSCSDEEFEKEYETDEYETKVKKLLANAHRRLKVEDLQHSRTGRKPKSSRQDRRLHSYSVRPKSVGKTWKS